jgi:hypothetical protein
MSLGLFLLELSQTLFLFVLVLLAFGVGRR